MKGFPLIPCLLLYASPAIAAVGPAKAEAEAIIAFNAGVRSQVGLFDRRSGKQYIVALEPEPDVHATVGVVDLVLTQVGGGDQNLLAPSGIYHGLQPYDLAALEFKHGADKSPFGRVRRIPIRRTSTRLTVTIEDVQVREVVGVSAGEGGSEEITSLRAKVSLDGGGRSSTSE